MGSNATGTLREIAELRDRVDADLDALSEFLPPREELVPRILTAAVGGAVAVLSLWFLGHRMKARRQEQRIKRLVQDAVRDLC
ncbi:MAG: hypothetical protein ACRDUY_16300 [Nitriliruptorales bacterium]